MSMITKPSILQQEFQGDATQLYLTLTNIIQSAKCYHLSVGPLVDIADLIEALV